MRTYSLSLFVLCFLFWGLALTSTSQKLPQFPEKLSSPLEIPLSLSGSYGEMRANHYHTGWDLQTGEKEGLSVLAIADGFVSRVRISSKGYGWALYVTHPQLGITSVYAHLSSFYPELQNWVKGQQYEKKANELDWVLMMDQFPVKRGQNIARSGNSGSSGGPHLHFEIRNTVTEKTLDPALLGYKIPDVTRPLIESMSFVPKGDFTPSEIIPFRFNGESLGKDTLFEVVDTFGVAVQVYDWVLDADHACGIKQILTLWDGNIVSEWLADSLDFKEIKHVNAQWLAGTSERHQRTTYRTYQLPNAPGTGFLYIEKGGWMTIKDTMTHAVTVMVADFSGNATCVYAYVKKKDKPSKKASQKERFEVDWMTGGTVAHGDWCLRIPKDALYESTPMSWTEFTGIEKTDSILMKITIEPKSIAFKNSIFFENNSASWMAMNPEERKKYGWMEVRKDDEWHGWDEERKSYAFSHTGTYRWVKDTKSPEIRNAMSIVSYDILNIDERESGLKSYEAYLGDQWVLLYWDAKNNNIIIDADWRKKWDGKSQLRVNLTDKAGNASEFYISVK
jgi:hypothetical protein